MQGGFSLLPAENMQGLKCRPSWHIIYLLSVCMSLFYHEGLLWCLTTAWRTLHSSQLLPPVSPTIYYRLVEPGSEVGLVWGWRPGWEDGAESWGLKHKKKIGKTSFLRWFSMQDYSNSNVEELPEVSLCIIHVHCVCILLYVPHHSMKYVS